MGAIFRYSTIIFILSAFTLVLSTCNSGEDEPTLTKIELVSSGGTRVDLNETISLTVLGFDQFNQSIDVRITLQWSVNNTNASVDQSGNVTGLAVGTVVVTAAADGLQSTITMTVWDSTAPRIEIYVSDAGNFNNPPWKILRYDEDGQNPEVYINSNLGWPQDIVFLEDDNVVLVSNLNTGVIAKYNSSNGAFIGAFASGIGGPTRMKIGKDGLLYVLQWSGNGRVLRYQLDGTLVGEFTSVPVNESIGLDWDTGGNLYVSSFSGGSGGFVRKFSPSGADLGLFINSNLQGPTNIWFDEVGNLIVNDWQAGVIRKFDSNGVFISNIVTGLSQPEGIELLPNGNFAIGNGGTAAVKVFDTSGNFIKDLVPSGSGGLIRPNAVVLRKVNF